MFTNILNVIDHWNKMGSPDGAMVCVGNSCIRLPIQSLFPITAEQVAKYESYLYYDPPEIWLAIDDYAVIVKMKNGTKIRCRPKTVSIDDAYNEWFDISGLLLEDVPKFEFQYLSGSESYNQGQ